MKQSLVCVFLPPMIAALSAAAAPSDQMARTVVLDEIAVKNLGLETVEAGETTFAHTVLALGQIVLAVREAKAAAIDMGFFD